MKVIIGIIAFISMLPNNQGEYVVVLQRQPKDTIYFRVTGDSSGVARTLSGMRVGDTLEFYDDTTMKNGDTLYQSGWEVLVDSTNQP